MDHAGAAVGPLIASLLVMMQVNIRTISWIAAIPGLFAVLAVG